MYNNAMEEELKQTHPDYSADLTDEQRRQHLLHRVIAASAFIFAICILPVAQYYLVSSEQLDGGQVAGVSTVALDQTGEDRALNVVEASPTPSEEGGQQLTCSQKQQKDLEDLDIFLKGKKSAMERNYLAKIAYYQEAIAQIEGDSAEALEDRAGLLKLIEAENRPYLNELAQVESVVSAERTKIQAVSCE